MLWVLIPMTLALLVLAVSAGSAWAEGEGIRQYNPEQEIFLPESAQPEHQEGESKKHTAPSKKQAQEPTETTAVEDTMEPEEPAEEAFTTPGGGHPGPGEPPSNVPNSAAHIGVGEAVAVAYPHASTTPATLTSGTTGGGSSPLVPVLVAIAILAAISIGAVIYRHRHQPSTSR